MMKTKFKDFITTSPRWLMSTDINEWLGKHPNINIVRWSASPCGKEGTRLIIEYEELPASTSDAYNVWKQNQTNIIDDTLVYESEDDHRNQCSYK